MPKLHLKVKAIRLLRRLTQERTAEQTYISLKSYQRKEVGTSPISDQELAQLCVPFQCSIDDIRNFDLENNTFSVSVAVRTAALELENTRLKSELSYHRQLYDKLFSAYQAIVQLRGKSQGEG